jgi:hypothetical protein
MLNWCLWYAFLGKIASHKKNQKSALGTILRALWYTPLFQWIHQQVYGKIPQTLPLIGIIEHPSWESKWNEIENTCLYTDAQQGLAVFLAVTANIKDSADLAIQLVKKYLAEASTKVRNFIIIIIQD